MSDTLHPDELAVVTALLTVSGTAVYALVGEAVHIGALPSEFLKGTGRCIVVRGGAGKLMKSAPVGKARIQLDCYGQGDNPEDAKGVWRAAAHRMLTAHNEGLDSGVFKVAVHEGGGDLVAVPQGVRPFVTGYFRALIDSEEE